MTLKATLRQWCPPAVAQLVRRFRPAIDPTAHRFAGEYATWGEASAQAEGYDAQQIFEKTRDATLKVVRGEAAFERDSVTFEQPQYPLFLTSSLLYVGMACRGQVSILDFGGALGSSYFQTRTFTSSFRRLRWSVVEQAHYVEYGRNDLQTEVLRFHPTIEQCVRTEKPNLAILSGVLSWIENPYAIIEEIVRHRLDYVIVDRQPLLRAAEGAPEPATVVTVPEQIYGGSYPMWLLNEARFRAAWDSAYELVAEAEQEPLQTHLGVLPRRQMLFARRGLRAATTLVWSHNDYDGQSAPRAA
jgi:putative methyltransferase (TIGR04325 family)